MPFCDCFRFPKNKDTHGINTVRLAKVWMDKYQDIYLSTRPDLTVKRMGILSSIVV